MKKYIVFIFLAVFVNRTLATDRIDYDKAHVISLGLAYLQHFTKIHMHQDEIDWNNPITSSVRTRNSRWLIFVGFPNKVGPNGAVIIFEDCNDIFLIPAEGSLTADLNGNLSSFNSLAKANPEVITIFEACHNAD